MIQLGTLPHSLASFLSLNYTSSTHFQAGNVSAPCMTYIQEILEGRHTFQVAQFIAYSGKGINQLGYYYKCLETMGSEYFVGHVLYHKQETPVFLGFCFTNKCSNQDLNQLFGLIPSNITLGGIIQPTKWHSSTTTGATITLGLVGLCILMTILSTFIVWIRRKHKGGRASRYSPQDNNIVLRSFSLQESIKVFSRRDDIKFLNGLRTLSLIAVFLGKFTLITLNLGHETQLKASMMPNLLDVQVQVNKIYATILLSFQFAVDIFFYIGGFLLGYLFLKSYDGNPRKNPIMLFFLTVLDRMLRFWPMLILTVFLFWKVLPCAGSGPLYYNTQALTAKCSEYAVADIFFYSNFTKGFCLGWAWYVMVDVQLVAVCAILLIIYAKGREDRLKRWMKYVSVGFGLLISTVATGYCLWIIQKYGMRAIGNLDEIDPQKLLNYNDWIYIKPWSRVPVYVIGMLAGIFYYENSSYIKKGIETRIYTVFKKVWVRHLSMTAGAALILWMIFTPRSLTHKAVWPQALHTTFLGLGRIIYSIGIVLFTLPMILGFSSPFNTFFISDILQHIAKIAFPTYMIHYLVVAWQSLDSVVTHYVNHWTVAIFGTWGFTISLGLGLLLALVYEFPLNYLIRYTLRRVLRNIGSGPEEQVSEKKVGLLQREDIGLSSSDIQSVLIEKA